MNKYFKRTDNLNAKDTSILLFSIAAVIKAVAILIDSITGKDSNKCEDSNKFYED